MTRFRDRLGRIGYGGDYNPEQWPPDVWAEDMRLMREAGVTLVSVGIFGWAVVEPEPGRYDFDVYDRVLDLLADNGVSVCLATMTASPPPWLAARYPETLPERADGTRLWPGGRQHYCPSSPIYRDHAVRLVEQVARRYGGHPALALWHVGNEYGCHVTACYCDVSAQAFRDWLQNRYGSVDRLNEAWSTSFWSQRYGSFDEVQPPRTAPTFPNPAQQLDFARFSSDEVLACYRAERDVLQRITSDVPLTTNFVPVSEPPGKNLDLFTWAPHLDVVSYDSYPDPHDADADMRAGYCYDVMRGLRDGQPWLLMEQAPSAVNWRSVNGPKPPGAMPLWSWQAVAHGADAVMFFQWRQSRGGAEKFHSGMVPIGGDETRIFREVRELGRSLAAVPELAGSAPRRADVAFVHDWPSWWALELDSRPSDQRLLDAVYAHYAPLYEAGVATDVVPPTRDLSAYRLVVVPNLYLVDEAAAANLVRYVESGGTLVMSYFSGIVDGSDRIHPGGYPAPFKSLLGLAVEEFWPLPEGGSVRLTGDLGDATGSAWSENLRLEGAEAIARFDSGDLDGGPAVTRHTFGSGTAYYLGTRPDPATMRRLLDRVRRDIGVEPVLPGLPDGVRARARETASGQTYYVVLNHNPAPATVELPTPMRDALTDAAPSDTIRLASRGVAVLTEG